MSRSTITDLPAIERTVELQTDRSRVWQAITDSRELAKWFPDRADWEAEAGSVGTFFWQGHGDFKILVEAVDEPHYVAWRWSRKPHLDPASDGETTLVEWWLDARNDGGTTLRVRESGFRSIEHRVENEEGWTSELGELVELLESAN